MVLAIRKRHLILNCLTGLLIETSLIDSVTVRFGIGTCAILHKLSCFRTKDNRGMNHVYYKYFAKLVKAVITVA